MYFFLVFVCRKRGWEGWGIQSFAQGVKPARGASSFTNFKTRMGQIVFKLVVGLKK